MNIEIDAIAKARELFYRAYTHEMEQQKIMIHFSTWLERKAKRAIEWGAKVPEVKGARMLSGMIFVYADDGRSPSVIHVTKRSLLNQEIEKCQMTSTQF